MGRTPTRRTTLAALACCVVIGLGTGAPVALASPGAAGGPEAARAAAPAPPPGQGRRDRADDLRAALLPAARAVRAQLRAQRLQAASASPDSAGAKEVAGPDPLALVAVTWTGPAPDTVMLRSRNGTTWGAWTPVDPAGGERDGSGGTGSGSTGTRGSEPVWVGDSRAVQVRALTAGVPVTDRVGVTSIDPGTGTNDAPIALAATTASGAVGSPASPRVVTRAQWGADESLMTWPPEYTATVRAVTIHHTAGANDYTAAQSAAIVRGIYSYHARTQGWGDIGYNALVDRFGTVFEGRRGGLDRAVVAAHAGGFNRETFGVGMMGDYTGVAPPAATLQSAAALAAWKLGGLYRDPNGSVTLTSAGGGTSRYARGQRVTVPVIFPHRQVGATACPGNTGVLSMASVRSRVTALIGDSGANPVRAAWLARPYLGEPAVVESPTARGGRVTRFSSGGTVYWSAVTGAHAVYGAINGRYDAFGAAGSVLGLPTTDELGVADGRGRYQRLQAGSLYWTPTTGAWPVFGAIGARYAALGYQASAYGYPRSGEYAVPGGQRQDFERGSLTWNATTGVVS